MKRQSALLAVVLLPTIAVIAAPDRYAVATANFVSLTAPHSGPGRAERAKQIQSTSQERDAEANGTSRASRWLVQLQPGEYEVALEIDRTVSRGAHYDAGFHKEKKLDCFTADELKGPTEIAKLFASEAEQANCERSDVKTTGNKMTITTTCEHRGVRTALTTEFTFGPDLIAILTEVRDATGAASTIRITAKRIGECKR